MKRGQSQFWCTCCRCLGVEITIHTCPFHRFSQAVHTAACEMSLSFSHRLVTCYLLIKTLAERFIGSSLIEYKPSGVLPCYHVATELHFLRTFQRPLNHYSDIEITLSFWKNKYLKICNCPIIVIFAR